MLPPQGAWVQSQGGWVGKIPNATQQGQNVKIKKKKDHISRIQIIKKSIRC